MIVLNLDATPGNVNVWGELASCFLKLVMTMNGDYEDCNSTNERSIKDASHKNIPKAFEERHTRESWKLRCRWWATHHFSRKAYMQDLQAGKKDISMVILFLCCVSWFPSIIQPLQTSYCYQHDLNQKSSDCIKRENDIIIIINPKLHSDV